MIGEIGGNMNNKEFKTLEEQIEILKSKNLVIKNEEYAKKVLLREIYFFLNGYRHLFLVSNDDKVFKKQLRKFVLFRSLQVLGAYGFRGLIEQKANFVVGIPAAITALKETLDAPFEEYPYLMEVPPTSNTRIFIDFSCPAYSSMAL